MPLLFHNGTTGEATLGSTSMHVSSNVATTVAGVISAGVTTPNLVNAVTGVVVYFSSLPSVGDITVGLRESAVTVRTATINNADIKLGYNYVRFASTYTFATLTASAYSVRVTNTSANSGFLVQAPVGLWFELSYNLTSNPINNDDVIIAGWHDSGLTPIQWDISGTSTVFGAGTIKNIGASIQRTMQCGLMIGNGATVKQDTAANCTVEIKGSIFITLGGTYDKRANLSNIEIVSTLIMNCDVASNDYVITMPANFGGRMLSDGMTVNHRAQYASGVGTAANPLVTSAVHGLRVNDEIIIPGLTHSTNQVRFVISIPTTSQLVWSATRGGAESAITNTPAVGSWLGNTTRNSVVTAKTITRGYALFNNTSTDLSSFSNTRWEYASCSSGYGLNFNTITAPVLPNMNGMVGYKNPAAGRISWFVTGTVDHNIDDCILFETLGSNYSGQSGLTLQGASNKIVNRLLHFAEPGSTANCGGLSLASSATNNTINDSHFYGATANNGSLGYAIGFSSSHGNTFNNCTVNNSRVRAILSTDGFSNTFNNCNFGTTGTNVVDIFASTGSLITMLFDNCNFGSATRLSNVENCLTGTDIAFQTLDGNQSKHMWATPNAEYESAGAGLPLTTVRTPGSLSLAIEPRNTTVGGQMTFKVPANPTSNVQIYGYMNRNATFSSGELKVELFLPGTLLSATPDDTVTLSTTTGTWQLWSLNAYNAGIVARYATVRITAKTATAGAYAYLDDIYDAQLNNKVAGLDLWDAGHISPIMLALDLSSLPEQTRLSVWTDTATYTGTQKGKVVADTNMLAKFIRNNSV